MIERTEPDIRPQPGVAIFRKRLLSYSETFIADQGRFLRRYRPVFCGYKVDASGIALLEGTDRILLDEHSLSVNLSKLVLRNSSFGGARWIKEIERYDPSLIHAHFFNDGADALRIGNRLNLPVVTTVHGHDITKHENPGARRGVMRDFFDRVDHVIAVSNFIATQALARGCPEEKLTQHYIGIDLEKFTRGKRESESPSLLFVGRLVEKKGCTYLLQAMQKLKPRFPELSLTIVGDGELEVALRQEACQRKLKIEFAGSEDADQIRNRLASCWLFTAPSVTATSGDAEGLGMVFLEAQALQTPVVSFRHGGVVEAVKDKSTALLCSEKDVDGLADNIATLLDNAPLRRDMGRRGRARVEEYFDIRKQCTKLEYLYDKIR